MKTKLQNTVFSGQRRGFWSKIFIWRNIQWASTSIARERNLVWVTRRLLSALPEIAGGKRSAYRHIGTTAPSVSEKPPQGALHQSANQWQTEQLSCWHWSAGRSNVFSAGKTAFRKRGRNGSPQSGKSNAVGAEDEQHPQCCYGNRFEWAYILLILCKKSRCQQTAAFPFRVVFKKS